MQRNNQHLIKRIPFAFILLLGVVVLAACGNKPTQQPAASAPAEMSSTDTTVTESQENTEVAPTENGSSEGSADAATTETNTESAKGTTDTAVGEGTMATEVGEGTFSGLADAHSAEVMVDGTPIVYQLNTAVQSEAASLKEGDEITFKYTEKAIPGDASMKVGTIVELKKK